MSKISDALSVIKSEIFISFFLFVSSVAGILIANSWISEPYNSILSIEHEVMIPIIGFAKSLSIKEMVNDILMPFFFLLVGLELKREILFEELSSFRKASLPILAAIGGVAAPVLIFFLINYSDSENLRGIAIPMATDIAFVYGAILLLRNKIPAPVKTFVISLAVVDDLMAIIVIALLYSSGVSVYYLGICACIVCVFCLISKLCAKYKLSLLFWTSLCTSAVLLWAFVMKSGVHPTIAGVIIALCVPAKKEGNDYVHKISHAISPFVNYLVLPIFIFVNSGISIFSISISDINCGLFYGIALGLFVGKQAGIFLFSTLSIKLGFAQMPTDSRPKHLYAASLLCGIGFTMSIFMAELAFESDPKRLMIAKLAVITASVISCLCGLGYTYFTKNIYLRCSN